MNIDWMDKILFLMGICVPYYWVVRIVRKGYLNKEYSRKKALEMLGVNK